MKIMKAIRRFNERGRKRFYDGPSIYDYPGRRLTGYRSPNLIIAQWMHAFTVKHFTMAGRMLFLLSLAIFLAGMTALEMPIYYLSFALVALFLVDIGVGLLHRPILDVARSIPASAPAGSEIPITYTITNRRSIPAWGVYVETIPLPPAIHLVGGMAYLPEIPAGATVQATNTLQIGRRGRYFLPAPVADSSFPFGLWRWGSRGPATAPLLIYPEYAPLTELRVPTGSRRESGDSVVASFAGASMEFQGTREYRYGDNPRHIHAPSWARLRTPVIKEFRDETHTRASIVVDTYTRQRPVWQRLARRPHRQFEAVMSLVAAIAEALLRRQYSVDIFIPGYEDFHLHASGGPEDELLILETIAALDENLKDSFTGLAGEHLAELHQSAAAFVLLLEWDPEREQFVDELHAAGVGVRPVLVTERLITFPQSGLAPVQLSPDDILAGKVTEL